MWKIFKDVEEFHRKMGYPIGDTPATPPVSVRVRRVRLMAEECQELMDAIGSAEDNPEEVAQEAVDLIYIALGGLAEYGIKPDEVWNVVHRANMRKLPVKNGKARKPEGWKKPDIQPIIDKQRASRCRFRLRSVWGFKAYPRGVHLGPFEVILRSR